MIPRPAWSGLDYPPLPHESSLSALWRLTWWNALSFTRLRALCKGTLNSSHNSFIGDRWMDPCDFVSQTHWKLPTDLELKIARAIGEQPDLWFYSCLRICPICLEAGYHSVWHQFKPLHYCPVHHCLLQTRCQSCGMGLESYGFSRELLETPFQCYRCGGPISGVAHNPETYLEFRMHHEELVRAFQPFKDWIETAEAALSPVRELCRKHRWWPYETSPWGHSLTCWRFIHYQLHPPPASSLPPLLPKLIRSPWRVKIWNLEYESMVDELWDSRRPDIGPEATAVYRDTLRQLQCWLSEKLTPAHRAMALRTPTVFFHEPIDLLSRDPRELGYMLLRAKFEWGTRIDLAASVDDAQLRGGPDVDLPHYRNRIPEVVLRRIYVAIYAGLVALIYDWRRESRSAGPYGLETNDEALVTQMWEKERHAFTGWVMFPAVEEFPLSQWLSTMDQKEKPFRPKQIDYKFTRGCK